MRDIVEFWSARAVWSELSEETRQSIFAQIRARLSARSQQNGSRYHVYRCVSSDQGHGEIVVVGFSSARLDSHHCFAIPEDELLSHYFEKVAFAQEGKSAQDYAEKLRDRPQG